MSRLIPYLLAFLLSACATAHHPDVPSAPVAAGATVETISSTVTLSLHSSARNLSGRGVMVYRRPDQLRLVMLSPFGTTVMEAQVMGDRLTLCYPTSGVAYQGRINELPASASGQRGLALLRWVLESDPPSGAPRDGEIEHATSRGTMERISMRDGQVVEKDLPSGERVQYRKRSILAGVCLPLELQMENADGDRIRLTLEDPEVNIPLDDQMFNVPLQGMRLLPLSELKTP